MLLAPRSRRAALGRFTDFGPTAERTIRPSADCPDRDGYLPDFIPGYEVPLPSRSSFFTFRVDVAGSGHGSIRMRCMTI
jgi:hypothetical protein